MILSQLCYQMIILCSYAWFVPLWIDWYLLLWYGNCIVLWAFFLFIFVSKYVDWYLFICQVTVWICSLCFFDDWRVFLSIYFVLMVLTAFLIFVMEIENISSCPMILDVMVSLLHILYPGCLKLEMCCLLWCW